MRRALVFAALLGLAACDRAQPVEQANGSPNEVFLVAIAPDGTHLWRTGGGVYFASSGTQRTVSCGKSCTRQERVATAQVMP